MSEKKIKYPVVVELLLVKMATSVAPGTDAPPPPFGVADQFAILFQTDMPGGNTVPTQYRLAAVDKSGRNKTNKVKCNSLLMVEYLVIGEYINNTVLKI